MDKFEVNILGCGSALPTLRHFPTSQVVNFRDNLFMIDCGEGAQMQLRKARLKFTRLGHVFISHLHGDHCFGLPGLISTFGLLGRTAQLYVHAPYGLKELMEPLLAFFCANLPFKVVFEEFDTNKADVIYQDRSLIVKSIPLRHRIPCCGFLFIEKQRPNHVIRAMTDFYGIPPVQLNRIKNGEDYTLPSGQVIPNNRLTTPAPPPLKYAYCSDTMYCPHLVDTLRGVDLLFHEATFASEDQARAEQTCHSTARQAASLALAAQVGKLVIGHFSARYDDETLLLNQARSVFPKTVLANENMCLRVGEQDMYNYVKKSE